MNASKENAKKVRRLLAVLPDEMAPHHRQFVWDFLEACVPRLPTEASYKRHKQRDKERRKEKVLVK